MSRQIRLRAGLASKQPCGATLVETMIALFITGLAFSAATAALYFSMKTSRNMNEQFQAQTSASNSAQRIATMMRQAQRFATVAGDDPVNTTFTQMLFLEQGQNQADVPRLIKFNSARKRLEYFQSGVSGGTPTLTFDNIDDFQIVLDSFFRVTMYTTFRYHAYKDKNNIKKPSERGQFITTIIARNHYLDVEDPSYESDASSPATLY